MPQFVALVLVVAAALIADAVQQDRSILVVGDFDADGATGTALAVLALRAMGGQRVTFRVPNRFEFGYGLTAGLVGTLAGEPPDVALMPRLRHLGLLEFHRAAEAIERVEQLLDDSGVEYSTHEYVRGNKPADRLTDLAPTGAAGS